MLKDASRLLACVVAVASGLAASEVAADDTAPAPGTAAPAGWLAGDGATGDWFGVRSRLADRGVSPYAVWTGEVFRNFDGGIRTATDWEGLLEFGVDLHLEKALGWHGATVHASALWIQDNDDPSADFVGNFDEVSNIAGVATVRFYQLYFEHELLDGALSYKLGQLTLDENFMISDGAALFLNASFGTLPVESANTPAPIYPLAALGGWVRWTPRKSIWLQAGIYNGDAGTQDSNDSGFDYDFGSAEGAMLIAEAGVDSTLLGRDFTYKIGGFYHSGELTDFSSGSDERGTWALYLVLDQVLLGARDQGLLGVFFRAGLSPWDDRNVVDWCVDAGITGRGLREKDRVGLAFSHSHFGKEFARSQDLAGTPIQDAESVIELTYQAALTPWFTVQPTLQYVIDPQDANASNAFVGGLRLVITL